MEGSTITNPVESRPASEPVSGGGQRAASSSKHKGSNVAQSHPESSKVRHVNSLRRSNASSGAGGAAERGSTPSVSAPGGRRVGGAVFRKDTKQALAPARELNLGRHAQALNLPALSLSSESSHLSELEIFDNKQYGPGDVCPYLNKHARHRAPEILEASRRQFLEENSKKTSTIQNMQSVLLSSVTLSVEKMLATDQRNGNGAVVQVEFKNLDSQPSLTEEQIDDLFWARMEDLKNG